MNRREAIIATALGCAVLPTTTAAARTPARPRAVRRILLSGGSVLLPDPGRGTAVQDVLIEGARIVDVAPRVTAPEAERVDASGCLVMPGLIDAHRHLWQGHLRGLAADATLFEYMEYIAGVIAGRARPEDVYAGTRASAFDALDAGVTTVMDWSHALSSPAHADAAVAALKESGIRAVFGHGPPGTESAAWWYASERAHPDDIRRVRRDLISSDDGLVTMMMAARGPEDSTRTVVERDWRLADELGLRISIHVGVGEAGRERRAIAQLSDARLLRAGTLYVHLNTTGDDELAMLRDSGGKAVICPSVEQSMGFAPLATSRLLKLGIRPALGVDTVTAASPGLLEQARAAFLELRSGAIRDGEAWSGPRVDSEAMIRMATTNGADALGLDDRVGAIAPGRQADVIAVRAPISATRSINPASLVLNDPTSVETVIVAGSIFKAGSRHRRPLEASLRKAIDRSRRHLTAGLPTPPAALAR